MSAPPEPLILAVDGGGSNCRAALFDQSGNVLGKATGGSANIATDFEEARSNVTATILAAYKDAGSDPGRMKWDVGYLGLAGANIGDGARRLEAELGFSRALVASDRMIAVEGALGASDGTVAQVGTGSFFTARKQGQLHHLGGWGFQLSDDCSGATLGRKLLRATVAAYEGLAPSSELTDRILRRFGGTPHELVAFAQTASPRDFGTFAIEVAQAKEAGDAVATGILRDATARMVEILDHLGARDTGPVCLLGGLASTYLATLPDAYRNICVDPQGSALDGAFSLAKQCLVGECA